jgi:hypothetical protein
MYYAIEIDSSLFLSRSFGIFWGFFQVFWGFFWVLLDVDLSSLFVVEEPPHRV